MRPIYSLFLMLQFDGHPLSSATTRQRTAISPLSAATLLLLVSLVVSTSPAVRGGPNVAELRPVGVRSVVVVEDRPDDDRSQPEASREQSQTASLAGDRVHAPFIHLDAIAPSDRFIAEPASPNLVREALLALPPPRA